MDVAIVGSERAVQLAHSGHDHGAVVLPISHDLTGNAVCAVLELFLQALRIQPMQSPCRDERRHRNERESEDEQLRSNPPIRDQAISSIKRLTETRPERGLFSRRKRHAVRLIETNSTRRASRSHHPSGMPRLSFRHPRNSHWHTGSPALQRCEEDYLS